MVLTIKLHSELFITHIDITTIINKFTPNGLPQLGHLSWPLPDLLVDLLSINMDIICVIHVDWLTLLYGPGPNEAQIRAWCRSTAARSLALWDLRSPSVNVIPANTDTSFHHTEQTQTWRFFKAPWHSCRASTRSGSQLAWSANFLFLIQSCFFIQWVMPERVPHTHTGIEVCLLKSSSCT